MSKFLQHISIHNFKSIKDCEITELNRINLFIGRPNVGKSNIIEALSLFSIPFLKENSSKKLSNLIRLEAVPELFHNGSFQQEASIKTNLSECTLRYTPKEGLKVGLDFSQAITKPTTGVYSVDEKFNVKGPRNSVTFESPVKKYIYNPDITYKSGHAKYLIPPFGSNLLNILEEYPDLKKQVTRLFDEYGQKIAFDKTSQTIKIIQRNDDEIFLVPYNSMADTLQRIIFYKAAIASNDDSILLLEEPEAHSFPPYMAHLTQEMIHTEGNQYFVATHSPFILNDLLENGMKDLAVFVVYFEDQETKVRKLTAEQLHDIFQNGVDVFTNSEMFDNG